MTPDNLDLKKTIINKLFEELDDYQIKMKYLSCDAPIGVLCLKKSLEKILIGEGCLRVIDVLDLDLLKIEGVSESDVRDFTSRLNQFLSV